MKNRFFTVAGLMVALVALEYFAANTSAYALNEMTGYQVKNLVMLISLAFVTVDVVTLVMVIGKIPDAGLGYLLTMGWFLSTIMRAGLVWQGLIFGFAMSHPEWLAIAPIPVAIFAWLLNLLLVWLAGKAFQMSVKTKSAVVTEEEYDPRSRRKPPIFRW